MTRRPRIRSLDILAAITIALLAASPFFIVVYLAEGR
ncbi:hypothetical protein FHU14_004511 [Mesorhizobium sp. RMAD-H1]|nr:hypothetical protein [Mesorhizobium sp. RMAD-H1]